MKPSSSSEQIAEMFSGIARRYDLANHILSFYQDRRWRELLVTLAAPQPGERLLDVATGTGDIAITFAQAEPTLLITGLDLSEGMLRVAAQKIQALRFNERIELVKSNALALPFPDRSFDLVTLGFGLRNLPDRERGMTEMSRVLRPEGRLLILEFSVPTLPLWREIYLSYLRKLLPFWGGVLTGSREPYQYLRDSIQAFPQRETIVQMMKTQGLEQISLTQLCGGIATIYLGHKRSVRCV
jgi:demethylmenaquinone methyltransferase/2-methoxy-6-polyprenyl-1,4-benzoquinol methylase